MSRPSTLLLVLMVLPCEDVFMVLFLLVKDFTFTDASTRCLQCNNVAEPTDCQTVKHCGDNEVCFIRKKIVSGTIYYDMGCKLSKFCSVDSGPLVPKIIGKRFLEGTIVCDECCGEKDLCNSGGLCGTKGHQPFSCFHCEFIDNPQACNHTDVCRGGLDRCYIARIDGGADNNNMCLYSLGCMSHQDCHSYNEGVQRHGVTKFAGLEFFIEYFDCCSKKNCNNHNIRVHPRRCSAKAALAP